MTKEGSKSDKRDVWASDLWASFFRTDWLNQSHEAALEPELRIVDPHQHFWPHLNYGPAEFFADTSGAHKIIASVHLETGIGIKTEGPEHLRQVGETELVLKIVDDPLLRRPGGPRLAAGIVGDVKLDDPVELLDEAFAAHIAAGGGRFRGIRFNALWADGFARLFPRARPDQMQDPAIRRGLDRLAAHGLCCDLLILHQQMAEAAELARAMPQVTFILNHLGGFFNPGGAPSSRDSAYPGWLSGMKLIAREPNVIMKLGGMANAFFSGWHLHERPAPPTSIELAETYRPFIMPAIDAFGAERCMFESNYPVDRQQAGYTNIWNAFKILTANMDAADRAQMFAGTAARIYKLDLTRI